MFQHALLLALVSGLTSAAPSQLSKCSSSSSSAEIKCPIILDGRVKTSLTPSDFDSASTSPFNPDYVKGNTLQWSQILQFPSALPASRFDGNNNASAYKPVEVTISDASVFQTQNGFRRAGLQLQGDTNTGSPADAGVRTIHFSVRQDPTRPLNLTHEYLNVWHEASDYSADQFMFEAGTIIGQAGLPKNTFKVLNRQNQQIWSTPIESNAWQNFAITLDFNKNTLQVYYSKDNDPLKSVTSAVSNDNSGGGQYQIGILKKPTGTSDVVNSGYQEKNLNEGQIYGGLFIEDSSNGCISL